MPFFADFASLRKISRIPSKFRIFPLPGYRFDHKSDHEFQSKPNDKSTHKRTTKSSHKQTTKSSHEQTTKSSHKRTIIPTKFNPKTILPLLPFPAPGFVRKTETGSPSTAACCPWKGARTGSGISAHPNVPGSG